MERCLRFFFSLFFVFSPSCTLAAKAQQQELSTAQSALQWRQEHLTQFEQEWLNENPIVIHGARVGTGNKPFEFTTPEGEFSGLTADYVRIFGEKLGIKFNSSYRTTDRFNALIALETSEINLITYIHKTPLSSGVQFSDAIISMPIILLGKEDSPIVQSLENLTNEKIIVQERTYAHRRVQQDHPSLKFHFVKTVDEGVRQISSGEADIFIHNAYSLEYHQRLSGITNVKVIGDTPYYYSLYFAVSPNMTPLIGIMDKVIKDISKLEKRLIFDKWVNIEVEEKIDTQSLLIVIFISILVISFVIIFFTYWNRRLSTEVDNRTRELRDLARHLDNVREQEKAKLARDMHDELGHSLTSLVVGIKRLLAITKDEKSRGKINELNDLVLTASKSTKQIMTDLRPSILEDLGLVAAIDWLANDFKQKHDISCLVNARDLPFKLKDESAIALFRIVQEFLTNTAKHANATQVQISVTFNHDTLFLSIEDDGAGFNQKLPSPRGCYGLKGMRERTIALGGAFEVNSEVGEGVMVNIDIPILSNTLNFIP